VKKIQKSKGKLYSLKFLGGKALARMRRLRVSSVSADIQIVSPEVEDGLQKYVVVQKWRGFELRREGFRIMVAGNMSDLLGSSVAICAKKPIGRFVETNLASVRFHDWRRGMTFVGTGDCFAGEPQYFGMYCDKETHSMKLVMVPEEVIFHPTKIEDDLCRWAKRAMKQDNWTMFQSSGRNTVFLDAVPSHRNMIFKDEADEIVWVMKKIDSNHYSVASAPRLSDLTTFGMAIAVLRISGL
jgi:hypothetical protein